MIKVTLLRTKLKISLKMFVLEYKETGNFSVKSCFFTCKLWDEAEICQYKQKQMIMV
jgi:hypothetical protein